ncbi:RNA polymerase sigma factor SigY [Clostridium thermarum]|uniref:RNA polymerase sigma factor SigY n=1 Tax=Clostridium thermarum TaxID=1716543 RepID=UPI001120F5E2|nr:RNA polymerase sigma factor SigY [Clostridium thermarum]
MDELALIDQSKKGDKWAMNELLKINYPMLSGYVLKLTCDAHLAQDIIQETLLKAVVNISKYKPIGKFSTWLITIATNTFRDYLRKNKHFETLEENYQWDNSNPENLVLEKLEYKRIMKILSELPYEKRAVFILKHYYGYKYEEIAEVLKCPVGTVRSRLHNGIKYILSEFEKEDEE